MKVATRKQRIAYMKKEMIVTKPVYYETVKEKELLEAAARNNGIKKGVINTAVEAVINEFKNFLFKGHPVVIPGLGTFKVRLQAHACETSDLDNAGVSAVYRRGISYVADKELKQEAAGMGLSILERDIITMADDEEEEEEGPTP